MRILIVLLLASATASFAQTHTLSAWKGSAYRIDQDYLQAGYGPHVTQGEFINFVTFPALDIKPETEDKLFPEVYEMVRFGIIVRADLDVKEAGCYSLSLNSDDGSLLWLDEQITVSNDGHHKVRRVTDSIVLDARQYKAKVWYYNAYLGGYALELDINRIGSSEVCPQYNLVAPPKEPIVLKAERLFDVGKYVVPRRGVEQLEKLAEQLNTMKLTKLTIVGHTDATGDEEANQLLSEQRAQSVLTFLQNRVNLTNVEVLAIGKGESQPIGDNETEEGKRANRRVEVFAE